MFYLKPSINTFVQTKYPGCHKMYFYNKENDTRTLRVSKKQKLCF